MASGKVAYRIAVSKSDEIVEGLRIIRSPRCHCKCAYGEKKELHLGSPFSERCTSSGPEMVRRTPNYKSGAAETVAFKGS